MKKTYENSRLEWLTQKDIEANNESEFYVIVQVSEKIACPVIRVKNNLQCEICFFVRSSRSGRIRKNHTERENQRTGKEDP